MGMGETLARFVVSGKNVRARRTTRSSRASTRDRGVVLHSPTPRVRARLISVRDCNVKKRWSGDDLKARGTEEQTRGSVRRASGLKSFHGWPEIIINRSC